MKKSTEYDLSVGSFELRNKGVQRILWADRTMPVLATIRDRFHHQRPFEGLSIGCCLHVTAETANLMRTLQAGGADVSLCASNPLSTQDDVAHALVEHWAIEVFAVHGEDSAKYRSHLMKVLDRRPAIMIDDGCDLIAEYHHLPAHKKWPVSGACEETTTGVTRLRAMERDGALEFPVIAVNDSETKHMFDNRYGTGQSTIDGIIRATNHLIAGKVVVVMGYGWCGRGVASRARGMGANVIVTEVDPIKALEAVMDGYRVMPMSSACSKGDLFITLTGNYHVIRAEHFELMRPEAVVCNSGHFNVEIDLDSLNRLAKSVTSVRDNVQAYDLYKKTIYVLGEGRLINLAAAEGHPSMVMDMSFANQALGAEYICQNWRKLTAKAGVHVLASSIDQEIARLKLDSMQIGIDQLTADQKNYMDSWKSGS